MKAIFFKPLLFLIGSLTLDGGGPQNSICNLLEYERRFNLVYTGMHKKFSYVTAKNKTEEFWATNNIAIYDTKKNSTSYFFPAAFNEQIEFFLFETGTDSSGSMNLIQGCGERSEDFYMLNNTAIKRPPSDNIIIITYSMGSGKYTIWIGHKSGKDFNKKAEIEKLSDIHLDIGNRVIRKQVQNVSELLTENFSY